jgi:hypothetical protein
MDLLPILYTGSRNVTENGRSVLSIPTPVWLVVVREAGAAGFLAVQEFASKSVLTM